MQRCVQTIKAPKQTQEKHPTQPLTMLTMWRTILPSQKLYKALNLRLLGKGRSWNPKLEVPSGFFICF
jgi:hypothetical protein